MRFTINIVSRDMQNSTLMTLKKLVNFCFRLFLKAKQFFNIKINLLLKLNIWKIVNYGSNLLQTDH